jgi:prepilin-type N-terminal cleavage/methylation domain-containing protein
MPTRRRGLTLVEILVTLAIVATLSALLLGARPIRTARRLEIVNGHKQLEAFKLTRVTHQERWAMAIPHCKKLVDFCKGEPQFRDVVNSDGSRVDRTVLRLGELVEEWEAAVRDRQPTYLIEPKIEEHRVAVELRYLNLAPEEE